MISDSAANPSSRVVPDRAFPLADFCGWLEIRLRGPVAVVVWAVVFQLLFVAYLPSLPGPFVYDDGGGIITNTDLRFPKEPWRLLRDHDSSLEFDRRPVAGLVTLIDFQLWGFRSSGYRITNVLLHFVCGIAAAALAATVSARFLCPFPRLFGHLVAILWLFHPLSTSTVSFIYQRSEILMSLFYMLSLLSLLHAHGSPRKWRWLFASLASAFLSSLSKEPGLTLIAALPLMERICIFQSWRKLWEERKIYYFILLVGISDITYWVATGVRMTDLDKPEYLLSQPWEYFKCQCRVLVRYLRLVVWPYPLIFLSVPDDASAFSRWFPSFALLTSAVVILLRVGIRHRWVWLCLGGFLIILGPTSSFVPIALEPEAEFRMYLPSFFVLAGLIAAVGRFMLKFQAGKTWAIGIFGMLLLAAAIGSVVRNRTYSSALGLWIDTVQKSPRTGRAWANLGITAIQSGHFDLARQCAARLMWDGRTLADSNMLTAGERVLASVELEDGDPEKAIVLFRKVAAADPNTPGVYLGLASALGRTGKHEEALRVLADHYSNPLNGAPTVALLYREIYLGMGRFGEATAIGRHLEEVMPGINLDHGTRVTGGAKSPGGDSKISAANDETEVDAGAPPEE